MKQKQNTLARATRSASMIVGIRHVASQIGVSPSHLSRVVRGERNSAKLMNRLNSMGIALHFKEA